MITKNGMKSIRNLSHFFTVRRMASAERPSNMVGGEVDVSRTSTKLFELRSPLISSEALSMDYQQTISGLEAPCERNHSSHSSALFVYKQKPDFETHSGCRVC